MSEGILEVTDINFDEKVIKATQPVVVDFWAAWCGPCKAIAPIFEALSGAYKDKAIFAKCNVDDNPKTPSQYGIQAIPTLIFFKDGKPANRITGMVPKATIEKMLESLL